MEILEYGIIMNCRDIVFEDDVYDMENGHPGIVLLPTNDKDERAYCLYMTSNKKRAMIEGEKYTPFEGQAVKDSFVNLRHIITRNNNKEKELTYLSDEEFYDLLKKFYDYQIDLEPQNKEFAKINSKVKALLDLLETKINLPEEWKSKLEDRKVTSEELAVLENIDNVSKRKDLFLISLFKNNIPDNFHDFSRSEKRIYYKRVISLFNELKDLNMDKVNLSDPNNPIRTIYLKYRNESYISNVDSMFKDASLLLKLNKSDIKFSEKITNFIALENERAMSKAEKKAARAGKNRSAEAKARTDARIKRRNAQWFAKYGKFDNSFLRD